MKLSSLLAHFPEYGLPAVVPAADPDIQTVVSDSRRVTAGAAFVAVSGSSADGHRFIPDALARGAAAVVGEQAAEALPVPYIRVPDSRLALAVLSAGLNEFPARKLTVVGVTGTDGKTTTCNLIYRILLQAGLRTGMISTVNAVIGDEELDTGFHVTTPDAPAVQGYLSRMAAAGLTHVVLEATSHGLAQSRVAACDFDMGVVTNITHEHLDYHGSYAAYREAKGRLFAWLAAGPDKPHQPPRGAVLNLDDSSFEYLAAIPRVPTLAYGVEAGDVRIAAGSRLLLSGGPLGGIAFDVQGRDLTGDDFRFPVATRLIGKFNVSNLLAAIALTRGVMSLPAETVQAGLANMNGIPGRMEPIDLGQDFLAVVDFAHTPNALRRALEAARQMTAERVIALFGSAGLRDRQKRRMMAETAAELADVSVLTAEDPRTESLDAILAEMAAGAESKGGVEGRTFWRVPDRGDAIRFAVGLARPGDIVIACGKGHEQSMCFGETEYLWDDRIAMRAALSAHLNLPGPEMPFLPTSSER